MADSNITQENNTGRAGMNLDLSVNQIPKGFLSYALNANIENFDNNSVTYQNESGNEECLNFPDGFLLIGKHHIPEINKHIFFITNPDTGDSQIGYMENNDCIYHTYINSKCLNFNIKYPIHKAVHKITNCTTEVYWTDGLNPRRFLDLNNIPYKELIGDTNCDVTTYTEIDCNKLKVQPIFSIPTINVKEVVNGGNNTAGTYQFAIQYCDVAGDGYTQFYSVTNPLPLANEKLTTADFNYPVGKSIVLNLSDIDVTGYFQYFNLAVIKTVNDITSVELVGTYLIDGKIKEVTYSGQNQTQIKLTVDDIFEKFPYYEIADDLTAVQDILVWKGLTSIDRINYQKIANKIKLHWQTWRIPNTEDYSDEINAANLRGYLRDEVYPFEIQFELDNGKQTDSFHIPGRAISSSESVFPDVTLTNNDYVGDGSPVPYWQIYNTASVLYTEPEYTPYSSYKGPYQYGDFAYWESIETYPCNTDIWGDLAGKPIRHHKFPDLNVSPIFENPQIETNTDGTYTNLTMQKNAIFPIGVRIDVNQVKLLIEQSDLTEDQKNSIVGFRIVRGDRSTNKSIVAKGILRNVGKYTREGTTYYYPNYPYNDLNEDPFLLEKSNAYFEECKVYKIVCTADGLVQYTDCTTNTTKSEPIGNGATLNLCSLSTPTMLSGTATITMVAFDTYELSVLRNYTDTSINYVMFQYTDYTDGSTKFVIVYEGETKTIFVQPSSVVTVVNNQGPFYTIKLVSSGSKPTECYPNNLNGFSSDDSKYRQIFNSPETSFGQPFLGTILKLESVIFGSGKAHYVPVKNNALYKLLTKEAQQDALKSSETIANITAPFSATAMFTAYQAYLQIYINGITRKNYGYSYNSIADYSYFNDVNNGQGVKQRELDIAQYIIPGVQSVGDDNNINNYQRETSVYLKTKTSLPYPSQTPSMLYGGNSVITDKSRFINSQKDCSNPENQFDISTVCYYGSIKNNIKNQWGQIYTYDSIDTGFRANFKTSDPTGYIFGGDTFINKFSFKTKLPFFIDNRVNAQDDSDIYYDEIGNIAYPEYWHSARSILYDYSSAIVTTPLKNIISVKAHNFDCPNNQLPAPDSTATPPVVNPNRTFYDGKMYMFAYGIPTFYCESSVNVDLRQAFNNKEGDFYPHVSTGIPDNWLQETNVTIAQDNTYYYNVTYSKQNKENYFSHLPDNWREELCYTYFPYRAIYSDSQQSFTDNRINSWLIYRPVSYFDFPQNYGKFTSIDGIQNKAVLARFENKSLLYNTLLTIDTSNPKAAYLGNDTLFKSSPPIDFAETDLGYVGSQHKFLLKIPQGQITIDAKRGQVFLITGNGAVDLSRFGSGLNRFFTDHLAFEIIRYFPNVKIDNHFNGIGLHGVYDSKFDRVIITKLDYIPKSNNIKYDSLMDKFYIEQNFGETTLKKYVELTDLDYFCNKSWTLSFNMNTMTWTSFHSYIPNYYIAENNFFYSGLNESCDLDLIAAITVDCKLDGYAIGSTTTTSTTTTTTTIPPDCTLAGNAQQI